MLFAYSDYLDEGLLVFLVLSGSLVTALITGIGFHEFCHAYTADRLGDRTARMLGRVTLNPIRHLDPLGTILLMFVGFGWGKPVPVNPGRLRNGPEVGRAMVAAAGPVSNIAVAILAALPFQLGLLDWRIAANFGSWGVNDYLSLYLGALVVINVLLAVFNLIPVAPLDGFAVAIGLMPRDMARSWARLEQYGPGILMLLIALPYVTQGQISILRSVMVPVVNALVDVIAGQSSAVG